MHGRRAWSAEMRCRSCRGWLALHPVAVCPANVARRASHASFKVEFRFVAEESTSLVDPDSALRRVEVKAPIKNLSSAEVRTSRR